MQNADKQYRHSSQSKADKRRPLFFLLAFLLPFLTMLLIYAEMGMAPFGGRSVLLMDMSEQYVNFFAELKQIVRGDSSIYFSWNKSFGASFIGVFAYYLASPFSVLTIFFKPENLPVALLFLTCLKIGMAGFTLNLYFNYAFRKTGLGTLLFSLCYALMSYSFSYSLSIMWLDGLIWLPVILLGIEKHLAGKFPWILTLSLSVMFVSNYYIAYMIGLFCVLYFLYRFFSEKRRLRQFGRLLTDFIGAVVIAAGMAAWLLLPTGLELLTGKLAQGAATADKGMYFMSVDLFKRLLPGQYDGITYGLPYLFCGTLVLVLAVIYFFNPRIPVRERLAAYVFVRLMIISFCSKHLNFLWHGLQYPNWFPFRNSFLFSFLLIFLAFRSVGAIPLKELKQQFIKNAKAVRVVEKAFPLILIFFFSLQAVELYQNGRVIIRGLDRDFNYVSMKDYQDFYQELLPLVEQAESSPGFFRIEKDFERSKNDALLLSYKGITHYSSAFNYQVNSFSEQIGLAQGWIWNSYFGHTPLTDMIFNVKYMMSRKAMPAYYKRISENGSVTLYENPAVLPVAFMTKELAPIARIESRDFEAQNEMLSKLSGLDHAYFTSCEITALSAGRYCFTASENAPYFLSITVGDHGYGSIYANEVYRGHYWTGETQCILYIGDYQKGEAVVIDIENMNEEDDPESSGQKPADQEPSDQDTSALRISALNIVWLTEAFQALEKGGLTVTESGAGHISGQVLAQDSGVMMTSIPYDAGFQVKVDGQKINTVVAFDTFLAFPVPEGSHEISIRYFARGQVAGILVSLCSTICFAFLFLKIIRHNFARPHIF